jgi:hypothetical protein
MAINPSRSKLDKDDARAEVQIDLLLNNVRRLRQIHWGFFHVQLPDRQLILNLIYIVDRLPTLLKHAAENEDLITFVSRRTIFPQQAFCFPRLRKRAQKAVNAYLARFPATPLAIPLLESSDERREGNLGKPWDRISILFPHFLAFLVYLCFLWVTFFV